MPTARYALCAATLNGCIYAVGGQQGGQQNTIGLSIVQQLDPRLKAWQTVSPMLSVRSSFGLVAYNDKLYAVGGTGSIEEETLDTAEMYDPRADRWLPIAKLKQSRKRFGLAAFDHHLFAIGGTVTGDNGDVDEVFSSTEKYDFVEVSQFHFAPSAC